MKRAILFVLTVFLLSGCIRFNAGVWKKGPNDEEPKGKQVGFDTANYVPGHTPGNIQRGDES